MQTNEGDHLIHTHKMRAYIVTKDILNVRSSASDQNDDNFVGELLKGEIVYLKDEEIIGEVPKGGTSNIWKADSNNNLVAIEGVRPMNYEEKKQAFIKNPDCAKFIDLNDKTNESKWKVNWGFVDLEIWKIWKAYDTMGEGIKVAVFDSGLEYDHPDFKGKNDTIYYNAFSDSTEKSACLDNSSSKHGTECTAILASQGKTFYGVAPSVTLIIIKITNPSGSRKTIGILKGLEKAIELGVDIISMSLFLPKDANYFKIYDLLQIAYSQNITICAAAGNSGYLQDDLPAALPECISIGGINKQHLRSRASNQSETLCTVAPSEDLRKFFGNELQEGTSFSTPLVAGVIALIKSCAKKKNRLISNKELVDAIRFSSDKKISNYNPIEHGYGIIDPKALFNILSL